MFSSLEGTSVVVTGGTKGIGKGIARLLAGEKARVLLVGRAEDASRAPPRSGGLGYEGELLQG